jgi:DNA polymerase-3 subunit epsilon
MILFFDTETTGRTTKAAYLHPSQPDLVQIGALLSTDGGEIVAQVEFLVKPNGWIIPDEAAAVHGYTTEFCEKHGVPRRMALNAFNALCRRAEMMVAFNLDFDLRVMKTQFLRENITDEMEALQGRCAMLAAKPILQLPGQYGDYKWPNLAEAHQFFFNAAFDGAHSALADAAACARVWIEIQKRGALSV